MRAMTLLCLGAMACAGDSPDEADSALPTSEEICVVDVECCTYDCRSEAFWSTYQNACTCDTAAPHGDPDRECAFVDGACAFTE